MPLDLRSSVAVVTGAGSGIGRATSRALARHGAKVVVTDRDEERARAVAAEIGANAVPVRCDVTSVSDLGSVRDVALEQFGRVDLVMNNVGVLAVGPVEAIPLEGWERVVDINLMSLVRSLTVFLPGLLEQGSGHIVNTASTAGLFPYGYDRLPYTTTKHAIVGLSESLAVYLRPRGIGVSCFCPAGVMTNILEQITFYGEAAAPRGPSFGIVDADEAAELVVAGITSDRFLIVTTDAVIDELRERGNDIEAYLAKVTTDPPGGG
jgi:NAD(P)-dependent dehydrogenase (short-subunit alcohol dehydrogenase family)